MSLFDGKFTEEEDDEEGDDGNHYCMCGSLHGQEELDFNECDYCGKMINVA